VSTAYACATLFESREFHASQQINLLIEGAIVNAQVVGRASNNNHTPSDAAQLAKAMVRKLIEDAKTN